MIHSVLRAAALMGAIGLLAAARVQAQSPNPTIPTQPPASPIFPINQPQTFQYSDAQGTGSITFVDLGPDQVTGLDVLRVTITQNGATYNGSGSATPIPGAARPLTNLVTFTLIGAAGTAYFYQGRMGLGVEFQGNGTYHPVSDPTQSATWGLLFVPGTPTPVPPPVSTLTLNLDRGCGSGYPIGGPIVITFSAIVNDTVTLMVQRSDGTQSVIFANQPVVGGQTYSFPSFVSNVPGPRTLILTDASGAQATCSFTGLNTP